MTIPVPALHGPPEIRRRRSSLHGYGVVALEPINKNKRIITYAGERISRAESNRREARYLRNGHIWCFEINRWWSLDANVEGNVARFINHACRPNCYSAVIGHTVVICAGRKIESGEELTYNYYSDGAANIPCRCRPGCTYRL